MLKGTLRLFRLEGIPVDIHWTWLFVFVLVFWSLATNLFPATYPGLSGSTYLLIALVGDGVVLRLDPRARAEPHAPIPA